MNFLIDFISVVDLVLKQIAFVQINGLYINHKLNTINLNECCSHEPREKLKEVTKPSLTTFFRKR